MELPGCLIPERPLRGGGSLRNPGAREEEVEASRRESAQQISMPGVRRRSTKEKISDHASQSQGEGKSQGEGQGSSTRKAACHETPGLAGEERREDEASGERSRSIGSRLGQRRSDATGPGGDRQVQTWVIGGVKLWIKGEDCRPNQVDRVGNGGDLSDLGADRHRQRGAILKVYTASPQTPFRLHLCKRHCDKMESGDRILHAWKGRRKDKEKEKNLGQRASKG